MNIRGKNINILGKNMNIWKINIAGYRILKKNIPPPPPNDLILSYV
jgi:hypothetical protein